MSTLFGGAPSPKPQPQAQPRTGPTPSAIRPGATADAAARTGGGISPQFVSGMIDQQTGTPGESLGIIDEIRKGLGQ